MIVLDTSAIIELLIDGNKASKLQEYLVKEIAACSTISVNEVLIGAQGKQRDIALAFIHSLYNLNFDSIIAQNSVFIEESLYKKGKPIGKLDIFIAATCIAHDLPLLTMDKGFKHIDGLKLIIV